MEEGRGLYLMPEPSRGDLFFDIEGDRFIGTSGMEYLFGVTECLKNGTLGYSATWAMGFEEERSMFDQFIKMLMARWEKFPDFHIYHYAAYEPSAIKRLMGRYGLHEADVDRLLRAEKFVDLYTVARQSVRASVESYSIKNLEKFFGYNREMPLVEAATNRRAVEQALELGLGSDLTEAVKDVVQKYNQDDCNATVGLRDWLEEIRSAALKEGFEIPRPPQPDSEASEALSAQEQAVEDLRLRLIEGIPTIPEERSPEQQAIWTLGDLLSWHRRELKSVYWEKFRLMKLAEDELLEERAGIWGLKFESRVGGTDKCPIQEYSFPAQEVDIKDGMNVYFGEKIFGTVEDSDLTAGRVQIKKRSGLGDTHPRAVFLHNVIKTDEQSASLFRLGEWVAANGIDAKGAFRSARDLLLKKAPRLEKNAFKLDDGKSLLDNAKAFALSLDNSVLPIQGPPGSGKTFTASHMIFELLMAGKKVGVTANSHAVIAKVMEDVDKRLGEKKKSARLVHKTSDGDNVAPGVEVMSGNGDVLEALSEDEPILAGGTAWMWSREDFAESVDVLFVDEAGQMSLANALAVAPAAGSLVFVGDPQQLEQPSKGSHPDGAGVSALEHSAGGAKTLPADKGLFLSETWRLHPNICRFTSELFYENRLVSVKGRDKQLVSGKHEFTGAGLFYVPVDHFGNQNSSPEEVLIVEKLVATLTAEGSNWTDVNGNSKQIDKSDILIVAPYNAQVSKIAEAIAGVKVGTVDKFQGQQAPIVIYSMATSTHEDAPRGMEFLYSLNRLNVATSRAQSVCILVGSPRIFEPECRNPRQIQLANAFCRYLEMAMIIDKVKP